MSALAFWLLHTSCCSHTNLMRSYASVTAQSGGNCISKQCSPVHFPTSLAVTKCILQALFSLDLFWWLVFSLRKLKPALLQKLPWMAASLLALPPPELPMCISQDNVSMVRMILDLSKFMIEYDVNFFMP